MRKLKAAVSVLVANDRAKIDKINKLYMNNSTITLGEKASKCSNDTVYDFMNFMDRDERNTLRKSLNPHQKTEEGKIHRKNELNYGYGHGHEHADTKIGHSHDEFNFTKSASAES